MKSVIRRLNATLPRCAVCESVEPRLLLSATVRVVSYNMEADVNGDTTPLPGFYAVLEGIGEEKVQGNFQPIDVLGLEETTSNATTVAPVVTALNSYYGGTEVYAQSTYQATQSGSPTVGNGPNAVVYNTTTLRLIASAGVGTPHGSTNGEYRQAARYEFQPLADTGTTGVFYVYVSHMKSGTTAADATARGEESTIIRNDQATLPASASVVYTGDLNADPPEAEFDNFQAAGQGAASDPEGYTATLNYRSDSSTALHYRDDYQLMTANVLGDTGNLNYINGSFHVFGNNGTTLSGKSTNAGSNTSLNSNLFQDGGPFISASTLYSDLTNGSDHLPVVADYNVVVPGTPTIGSLSANPTSVVRGISTTLSATNVAETGGGGTITGVNFYRESNNSSGLQIGSDTLVGAGTQSGTTWTIATSTSSLSAGSYIYYAVATDSNSQTSMVASTTLTVTSPRPAVTLIGTSSGVAAGGTRVVIAGSGFTGAIAVNFGATGSSFTVNSDTQITAFAPAGSGIVDITVVTPGGTSATLAADRFTYLPVPAITQLDNTSGPADGGTTVVITGSSFTGATAVDFGANAATSVIVNSDTQITAVDPAGSGMVDVTVVAPGGTSAPVAADQFTYVVPVASPNLVGSPVINGDDPNGLTDVYPSQRSMVEDVVYTFDSPVSITDANAAFTVAGVGQFPGAVPGTLSAAAVPGTNNTQWAVTLTGQAPGVLASIANGEYSITINAAGVFSADDGTTQLAAGAGRNDQFYRLFGDINGDETVNAGDNLKFKTAIDGVYNAVFDFNGDGAVNASDNAHFKNDLAVGYAGDGTFLPTI